jgi:hypothetical protein
MFGVWGIGLVPHPNASFPMVRMWLVFAGCGVTLLWLAALYLYPRLWRDPHGEGQLAALVLASGLHAAVALPLAVACRAGPSAPGSPCWSLPPLSPT